MKKLSTMLLASTMALSMMMPVAAEGIKAVQNPEVKNEQIAEEAAEKVKETKEEKVEDKKEEKAEDKKEDKKEEKIEEKAKEGKHDAYIEGYEDGTVKPNGKITREEAAAIIHRLVGADRPTTMMLVAFNDLDRDRWSYNDVNILVNQNILNGYEDGTFKPEQPITRAEAAKMFARVHGINPLIAVEEAEYKGHWAETEIQTGITLGYINGYEDGTFRVDNDITRAEFVKMANKVFERCTDIDVTKIDDSRIAKDLDKDAWYFKDMVEAMYAHTYKVVDDKEVFNELIVQPRKEEKVEDKKEIKEEKVEDKKEIKEEKAEDKKEIKEEKIEDKKEVKEEKVEDKKEVKTEDKKEEVK